MTDRILRKTIFLKAPRKQVWDFLTEPDKLATWFHAPKSRIKAGEPLKMYGTSSGDLLIWGDVIEARPHDYLEYTFTVKPMGEAKSVVKWSLKDVPGGTQLSLEHSGLPASEDAFDLTLALDHGWDKHLMQMRDAMVPVAA